jgi:hypothetical protein
MFEKEAEEYAKDSFRAFVKGIREIAKIAFQKGAEFGYNKAKEWHYVKDELPQEMQEVIICIKDEKRITRAKRIKNDLWTSSREDFNTKEITAWKEIILPKESE